MICVRVVGSFKMMGGFESIVLGYPMMATQEDMERTVNAILSIIPKEKKKKKVSS
jgi:sirohydrochlorin cobaltochelatase